MDLLQKFHIDYFLNLVLNIANVAFHIFCIIFDLKSEMPLTSYYILLNS